MADRREGEQDESLDTKEALESLVHVAQVPGFVHIATGDLMHAERVMAVVNKTDVVITGGPVAVAAVQMGCNLLPVVALVVET